MKELFRIDSLITNNTAISKCRLQPSGNYVAIAEHDAITIYDSSGQQVQKVRVESDVLDLQWSENGTLLGVMYEGIPVVTLLDVPNDSPNSVNTGYRDASLLLWSKNVDHKFAVATKKGNLVLVDVAAGQNKVEAILGKHQREIVCGLWTDNDLIVLGSLDMTISISDSHGVTIRQVNLDFRPKQLHYLVSVEEAMDISVLHEKGASILTMNNAMDPKVPVHMSMKGSVIFQFLHRQGNFFVIGYDHGKIISRPIEEVDNDKCSVIHELHSIAHYAVCSKGTNLVVAGKHVVYKYIPCTQ